MEMNICTNCLSSTPESHTKGDLVVGNHTRETVNSISNRKLTKHSLVIVTRTLKYE